jgi:hypothetical protein
MQSVCRRGGWSEAHRLMETSTHIGKIVLTIGHP